MANESEKGIRWWLRYVVVPLVGSGGIVAVIVALIVKPPTPSLTPTNSPTVITTATFTLEPTVTVFATPTSALTPTSTPIPSPFFYDAFYSNQHGWALDILGADRGIVERYIRGGKFVHSLDCSRETTICREFVAVPGIVVDDFSFSFESQLIRVSEYALIGIIFRKKDDEYYYVYFQNDGEFIVAMRYDGKFYTLQDWNRSDYINAGIGEMNTFGVSAVGPKFIVSANGYDIAAIEDGNIKSGGLEVGVMVPAGQSAQVEFDNMQVVLP